MPHDITDGTDYRYRWLYLRQSSKSSDNLNNIELHVGMLEDIFMVEMLD